ncbi:hypothetical protein ACOMHN_038219 [Nucella lapillus]
MGVLDCSLLESELLRIGGDLTDREEMDCSHVCIEEMTASTLSETTAVSHTSVPCSCPQSSTSPSHHDRRIHVLSSSSSPCHTVPTSSSTLIFASTNCDSDPQCRRQRRKRSPPVCKRWCRVARAGLWLLVLMSCLGVNSARPSSSGQNQRNKDVQSKAVVSSTPIID